MTCSDQDLARVFRAESGRVLAILLNHTRDMELAEDALQDACLQATKTWRSEHGIPLNPVAWLITASRRRLLDHIRKSGRKNSLLLSNEIETQLYQADVLESEADQEIPDERLKLIFSCCHPALSESAQIALTLKTLCGLSSREIARAFLVSEITMNQRLTRAKRKIKDAGIAYEVPQNEALEQRLPSVLSVIYLIFNESYSVYEGQTLSRRDLAEEAVRLSRVLLKLLPKPSVAGLLSLMLFHLSRFDSRASAQQPYIPLELQDRALWDNSMLQEARKILITAMAQGQTDSYQIQAAISALHSEAKSWVETDWQQICLLYSTLYKIHASPIIMLNLRLAQANSRSQSGSSQQEILDQILSLESELEAYQPYYAAIASLQAKLNQRDEAKISYNKAIALSKNLIERDYLAGKLQAL